MPGLPWCSTAGGMGLIPGWGTNPTSPAVWPKEKKQQQERNQESMQHALLFNKGSCLTVVTANTDRTISRALLLGVVLFT